VTKRTLHHCRVQGALQPSIEAHRTALGQVTAKRQRSKTVRSIDSLDASALLLMCGIVPRADSAHRCADLRARDDDGGSAGRGPRTNKRPQRKLLVWAEASGVAMDSEGLPASIPQSPGAIRRTRSTLRVCFPETCGGVLLLSVAVMEHVHGAPRRRTRHGCMSPRRASSCRSSCLESTQGGIRAGRFSYGHGY
jgi:hypothetical protein